MRSVSKDLGVKHVVWAVAETAAAGLVAHLPRFASRGWPNYEGRLLLLCLGLVTLINSWSAFRSTGKWRVAASIFGIRLWTASVFVGMGWVRLVFPDFATAADHAFSGPLGHVIVGFSVGIVIVSLLNLWVNMSSS